jgi:uncharacterized protein YjbI with pentapeptide repeats
VSSENDNHDSLGPEQAGKDLSSVDLRGRDLSGFDFSNAQLRAAHLQEAKVYGTTFRFADLSQAEFCDRVGTPEVIARSEAAEFLSGSLAGANLSGACLPKAVSDFPQLQNVAEASKSGTTILFAMLIACLFCLVTAGTFSDASLLTNNGITSALPGVGLTLPVQPFLYVAPLLLLAFHLYFLLNLQRYEELIADLPGVFPDGVPLDLKIYPWIFSSLALCARSKIRRTTTRLALLEAPLGLFLAYLLVPISIWMIWFRALALHNLSSLTTLAVLGVSISVSFIQFAVGQKVLREGHLERWRTSAIFPWSFSHKRAKALFPWWLTTASIVAILLFGIGTAITLQARSGKIIAPPAYGHVGEPEEKKPFWNFVVMSVGFFQAADVIGQDLSRKPASWTGKESSGEPELKAVSGAILDFQNLRFMRGWKVFLVNGQMDSADLTGAVLSQGDLRGADFTNAKLIDTDLSSAKISSINTPSNLRYSDLTRANLRWARLAGAKFDHADLTDANLDHADLTHTNFENSDLSGASFIGTSPSFEQLAAAKTVSETTAVDPPLLITACIENKRIAVTLHCSDSAENKVWHLDPSNQDTAEGTERWKKRVSSLQNCAP